MQYQANNIIKKPLNQNKMNKLTRNIVTFLVTFLAVHICSMYIMGGFDYQTVVSKLISSYIGAMLGMAVLAFINGND